MGVVGLRRYRGRRRHGVRSGRGGCGGRRTVRTRRPEEHRDAPWSAADPAADDAVISGSDSGRRGDGRTSGGQPRTETARSRRAGPKPKKQRSFWKELPILIGIALVLALLIKTFLVQAFSIPSDSMQNTLQQGDRVLVDKLTPWFGSEPERGEVVVFHDPDDWLAGEPTPDPNAVQTCPQLDRPDAVRRGEGPHQARHRRRRRHGRVQGHRPAEGQRQGAERGRTSTRATPRAADDQGGQFKVKVPEGKIWVMGDHRQNSLDSRYHQSRQEPRHGPRRRGRRPRHRGRLAAQPLGTLPVPDTFDQNLSARPPRCGRAALGLAGAVPLVLWRRRRRGRDP